MVHINELQLHKYNSIAWGFKDFKTYLATCEAICHTCVFCSACRFWSQRHLFFLTICRPNNFFCSACRCILVYVVYFIDIRKRCQDLEGISINVCSYLLYFFAIPHTIKSLYTFFVSGCKWLQSNTWPSIISTAFGLFVGLILSSLLMCTNRFFTHMPRLCLLYIHTKTSNECDVLLFCYSDPIIAAWWRHQMKTFSALLAFCAGNSPVPGEFPAQKPVTRSFDVFFDLRLIKRLSKQSWGWWFETLSRPLRRHSNGTSKHQHGM